MSAWDKPIIISITYHHLGDEKTSSVTVDTARSKKPGTVARSEREENILKIQFLNGGLANQAFQYIFARYFELSHPGEYMYMDDSYFAVHNVHNGYELEKVFGIKAHMLSECFDTTVWNFILEGKRNGKSVPQIFRENQIPVQMVTEAENCYAQFNPFDGEVISIPNKKYCPEILDIPGNIYYHGYWIRKEWFEKYKDTFLQEFTFSQIPDSDKKNLEYLRQIETSNSVCVHVRRGDYIALGWEMPAELYCQAMKVFSEQVPGDWHLFVFSDEISWCREHEQELGFDCFREITYIEGNIQGKNYLDLQLMTKCRAMVVSNSAFSYLAALLNPRKRYTINLSARDL